MKMFKIGDYVKIVKARSSNYMYLNGKIARIIKIRDFKDNNFPYIVEFIGITSESECINNTHLFDNYAEDEIEKVSEKEAVAWSI